MRTKRQFKCWLYRGLLLLALPFFSACNALKYVPEDEKLYTGAAVEVETPAPKNERQELSSALNRAVYPKPNSRFFWMRVGLWAHYKVERQEAGFITRFINKRFGEEPVYLSDLQLEEVEKILKNRSINNGFFYPRITSSVEEKERTASARYRVEVGEAYHQETYQYLRDTIEIDSLIRYSMAETDLTQGTRFDLDYFKQERRRIDNYLKERGYYRFNGDYLIFDSDTNQYDEPLFDLYLDMKAEPPHESHVPYRINQVYVYPDYTLENFHKAVHDTVTVDSIHFLQERLYFKPPLLREYIIVEPGELYNKRYSDLSTRRLSSIGIYQFASIRYDVVDSLQNDSLGYLNASILLTPGKKYNIRTGMQGVTKSTGFAGPGYHITLQNRNVFNGGEIYEVSGNIAYEFQISRGNSSGLNNFQFQLGNSLNWPRLIAPLIKVDPKKAYGIPNTKLKLNYTLQQRALYYTVNSFLVSFGYNWNSSKYIYHEINPFSLNYTRISNITPDFQSILDDNRFLERSFEDQFIPAMNYTFQYSELGETDKKNEFYFNSSFEQASLITDLLRSSSDDSTLFGLPYAQYLKGDLDFRHYLQLGEESQLVSRFFIGVGYPYGNSQSLPYIKQYYAGGPHSIRAFEVRSLGPGTYNPPDTGDFTFFDQSGDLRLELNTEYRFPLVSLLKGAVFFDAGNIWLWNNNPDVPGGKFTADWSQQIAMGTGFGIRLDIDVLVLRLDLGHPLRYPYEVEGSHWVKSPAFKKLVWNFAIGYPF